MNQDKLREALNSPSGETLKAFLSGKVLELRDITALKEIADPVAYSVEIKAQLKAYNKLVEILGDLVALSQLPQNRKITDEYNV